MGARKPVLPVIAVCCVMTGWLAWACVPAVARMGFAFSSSFASPPGGFEAPVGVAIDSSSGLAKGSVYVSDQGHSVIDKYSEAGVWQSAVTMSGAGLSQLTVDEYSGLAEGDVYAAGFASGTVYQFSPGLVLQKEVKHLVEPTDAVADGNEDVFVTAYAGNSTNGRVLEFNAAGEPINAAGTLDVTNSVVEGLVEPRAIAVSQNGEQLYVATTTGVFRYTISGSVYAQSATIDPGSSTGVSLTPAGDVLVDHGTEAVEYETSGVPIASFGGSVPLSEAYGIATGNNDDVFVADKAQGTVDAFEEGSTPQTPTSEATSSITSTEVTLKGSLSVGTTGYYFRYNIGESCEGGSSTSPQVGSGGKISASVSELQPHTGYTSCLVATNKYGSTVGPTQAFETESTAPKIEGAYVSSLATSSASVSAQISAYGLQTTYQVEYGPTDAYGSSAPLVNLGDPSGSVAIRAELVRLTAGSEYHYRIVATNQDGNDYTPDGVFKTPVTAVGSLGLPDNRVMEMVTPPNNDDADVYVPDALGDESLSEGTGTALLFQVALDGSAVTYTAAPTVHGSGIGLGDQYLAQRHSAGGWSQSVIQPPALEVTRYQGFSNDLSVGVLMSGDENEAEVLPPLTPDAPGEGYRVLYTRTNSSGTYRPLITNALPLNRSAASFGSDEVHTVWNEGEPPAFAGGSSRFDDLLFEANDALVAGSGVLERELEEDVRGEIAKGENTNYLYDSVDSELRLVDVSPSGKVVPDATFGGPPLQQGQERPGDTPPGFNHVISDDGSRVYWSSLESIKNEYGQTTKALPLEIYLRENPGRPQSPLDSRGDCEVSSDACTVQVSAGAAQYWTATGNGHYAFYTEHGGLYRFNAEPTGDQESREVLTATSADVFGVLGASEDGETVYFVAKEVLSGADSDGSTPVQGQPNLYVLRHSGAPVFIGTLSGQDESEVEPLKDALGIARPATGDWQPGLGSRTARVTGDGGGVVFMSRQEGLGVVGYPHGYPSAGTEEVYAYNALSNRLYCVSCGSTSEGASGYLPVSWNDTYMPHWISESGDQVFFDTGTPLVAQDTNSRQDVYEWEAEGTGTCDQGTGVNGGCVFLLSGGSSKSDSWFIGASASGNDVFMATRAQLAPEDQNETFDLYDARVDGLKPVTPPACTGTGCQGVPAPPPTFATPSSVTFEGVGNFSPPSQSAVKAKTKTLTRAQKLANALRSCRRDRQRKRRTSCEVQVRKHLGVTKKIKKTSHAATGRKHV
jgi:hypothetical protein